MPTSPTITNVSGNSFSVTVTQCDLDSDITIRDFLILENGVLTSNPVSYNKTSQTTIQYAGPTLPVTTLEVRRFTPRAQRQIAGVGITKISSSVWNKEFDRRVRIQEEVDTYGAGGGFSVRLPLDSPYSVAWNGDTLFSPTRNSLYSKIETLAPLNNPTFTGTPTVPTQLTADDSTRVASTAYVKANLGAYAPLASPTFTGNPTVPTQLTSDNSTRAASTAYVKSNLTSYALSTALDSYAPLASPVFTGAPTAPTAVVGTATTAIATMQALQRRSQPILVAGVSGTIALPATTFVDVVFDAKTSDTANVYNSTTGIYTAPFTGLYHIVCAVFSSSTTLLAAGVFNTANVELIRLASQVSTVSNGLSVNGSAYIRLNSGDQIKIRAFSNVAGNLFGGPVYNYLNVTYAGVTT
jgi:hypothetical protein